MSKPMIICCKEWSVTVALAALLESSTIQAVYSRKQLIRVLQDNPGVPVVLGLNPHEHVVDLYQLKPLLMGREGVFIARCFYWTDYSLTKWLGLDRYSFCSWDTLQAPFSRLEKLQSFKRLTITEQCHYTAEMGTHALSPMPFPKTEVKVLEWANQWLSWKLAEAGLNANEIRVLSLMAEGRKVGLPCRVRSTHKVNGLYKLGMNKHVMNVYRGVRVRQELQSRWMTFGVEISTQSVSPYCQETG